MYFDATVATWGKAVVPDLLTVANVRSACALIESVGAVFSAPELAARTRAGPDGAPPQGDYVYANSPADIAELLPWLVGYAQKTGQTFEQAAEAVLERWRKDPYATGKGWPLWHLAKHVDEFAEALPARLAVVRGGMVPVSSREEYAADAAEGTQF